MDAYGQVAQGCAVKELIVYYWKLHLERGPDYLDQGGMKDMYQSTKRLGLGDKINNPEVSKAEEYSLFYRVKHQTRANGALCSLL